MLHFRLATEDEVRQAKAKAETMEQENVELTGLLSKKEQELEQHIQEKVKCFSLYFPLIAFPFILHGVHMVLIFENRYFLVITFALFNYAIWVL